MCSVNARSAPAAASRRPQKKRTKKQAGTFPLSGPPPPIGHPIRHPMRRPVRRPLRRRGLTAGPRPVRPSASAGPCCPEMPPGDAAPGVERRSRSAGVLENFLSGLLLRTPEGRLSSDSKGLAQRSAKKKAQERPVCLFSGIRPVRPDAGRRMLAALPQGDHPGGMRTSLPTKVLARNSSCARRISDRGKVFATSGRISPRSM